MVRRQSEHLPFEVKTTEGSQELLRTYGSQIVGIYYRAFADLLANPNPADLPKTLEQLLQLEFSDYSHRIYLLMLEDQVAGFTSLSEAPTFHPMAWSERDALNIPKFEYGQLQDSTAIVGWTAIDPTYQGKGGWSSLMEAVDKTVMDSYQFEYMIRYVRTANKYDRKFRKRYKSKIIYETTLVSMLGLQKFFRIKMK